MVWQPLVPANAGQQIIIQQPLVPAEPERAGQQIIIRQPLVPAVPTSAGQQIIIRQPLAATVAETWETRIRGQHYSLGVVFLFVTLVLEAKVSLRGTARVLAVLAAQLGIAIGQPDWTTGRWWLLRVGFYKLMRPKERADDWVWFIDHSCQMGTEKCLAILGIRLKDLPPEGECLRLEHMEPLEILPVSSSNQETVAAQLAAVAEKVGVPRAIVRDDGADLRGGVRLFREKHPETADLYDIKHKTACLLKHALEADERWGDFSRRAGATKCQVQQTELAFLAPPSQRSKARYMNVAELARWGTRTLRLVEAKPAEVLQHVSGERLEEKLGWLREYRTELTEWSEMMTVAYVAEDLVRRQGIYPGVADELAQRGQGPLVSEKVERLREELLDHIAAQETQVRPGERLPGSTEVLESSFGKLKQVEKDQSRSGFTGLLLVLGALVSTTTTEVVKAALEYCPLKAIWKWCGAKLRKTVQAKRRLAYSSPSAQQNPDERIKPSS